MNRITSNVDFPSFFMRLGRAKGLSGGGGIPMPFEANVPDPSTGEMLGVAEGVGGLTEGASTSILVPDYQGVYVDVPANTPAWELGAVVYNRVIIPDDVTNTSSWQALGGAVIQDANTVTNILADFEGIRTALNLVTASNRVFSAVLWAEGANIGSTIHIMAGNTNSAQITLTGSPVRYAIANYGAGNGWIRTEPGDTCTEFKIDWGQYEDNVTIPGQMVRGAKIFAKENLNTIGAGNVVTESVGDWIDPLPKLVYAPEATNYFLNSHAPVTQTVSGRTGTHTVWCEGAGSVTLSGGLSGVVSDGVPITGDPGGVAVTCTVAGSLDFVMFEDALKQTYPIPTAGAPVTRTARALSFDGANHDPDQSGYYFEWEASSLTVNDGVNYGLLSFGPNFPDATGFHHPATATPLRIRQWWGSYLSFAFYDGKGAGETHNSGFLIDTDVTDSLSAWDNDPGEWTPPISSVDSSVATTIHLGFNSPYVIKFGPIRRYQAPLEEMKAQLEADIAAGEAA